jgi:16S rRNA (cytosine1402-N4)-methyltransferase
MTAAPEHVPVMMTEVMDALPLAPGGVAVDGTLGLAGHALEMAKRIQPDGLLIGLDWDKHMLTRAEGRLEGLRNLRIKLHHSDYRALADFVQQDCVEAGREVGADAILMDLGVSNVHLEDSDRGFTFREDGPLDMRMDRSAGEPASALLNRAAAHEIENILWNYGDERWAKRIAQTIVERRRTKPLRTTQDLADCVMAAIPAAKRDKRIHPATRTFQAIRIAVNHELDSLDQAVSDAAGALAPGGVLAVLAYHSGEDRAVKQAMRAAAVTGEFEDLTRKPLGPSEAEVASNPKSRSAKLRLLKRKENP